MDLTLLEVSLDGATVTANAPFSGRGSTERSPGDADGGTTVERAESDDDSDTTGGETGVSAALPKVIGVAFLGLVVLVALVKQRRSGEKPIEVE